MFAITHFRNIIRYAGRRLIIMKKGFVIIAVIAVIISCFMLTMFSRASQSEETVTSEPVKLYRSYLIKRGDTLSSIAKDNMGEGFSSEKEYIDEVRQINGFCGDSILSGAYIILPYYE